MGFSILYFYRVSTKPFPDNIPGAYKIDKAVRTPGAAYTLVHIRQRHYRPEATETDLLKVNEVQDDIYKILSYLLEKKTVTGVYDEGTEEFGALMMDLYADQKKAVKAFDDYGIARDLSGFKNTILNGYKIMLEGYTKELEKEKDAEKMAQIIERIKNIGREAAKAKELMRKQEEAMAENARIEAKIMEQAREYEKVQQKVNGAVGKLYSEGRIKVFAAETYEANLRAEIASNERIISIIDSVLAGKSIPEADKELPPEVTDMREDLLLHIISEARDQAAVTVYGGAHDWTNNIEKWNREHPGGKFSLIVITPAAYQTQSRK